MTAAYDPRRDWAREDRTRDPVRVVTYVQANGQHAMTTVNDTQFVALASASRIVRVHS